MKPRVLVVDDESCVREVLSRFLDGLGWEAACAASAEEALAHLAERPFDAVVLDNVLPGMSGLRALAEIGNRSTAPVLMMTGHYDEELRKDAALLGAKSFLKKPLDFDLLESELRRLSSPLPS